MSEAYVFDTEAIVAFLYDEPGHERVGELLSAVDSGAVRGLLSATNASEVYYLVARFEGTGDDEPTPESLRTADRDLRTLRRAGVSVERADWRVAGEVKADGSISLADAYAVALAATEDATLVVGGDDDFDSLPVDVDIERFRDHGV
ncbi:VapC toxin family PIN domain ribonuclease (plasmid) [Halorientalis sp. IM1011]|uniref:PIN domain-containing protein n=1 Tax=Halorientalis sp. IM1011 TaxID=1932360 RepID=UPI00097CC157|nr:PIN domain-containing protein [Halorientalis sp. IM1011]AQL44869.1 VapC toxin family PIN domain ribonuclease [Halorientalis sp. IM1011]